MYKYDARKEQLAIRKWLEKEQPRTISGRYYIPIPAKVYEGVGGFRELNKKYRQWRRDDSE